MEKNWGDTPSATLSFSFRHAHINRRRELEMLSEFMMHVKYKLMWILIFFRRGGVVNIDN